MTRPPPSPPLFPYTTLFRSHRGPPGARRRVPRAHGGGGERRHAANPEQRHRRRQHHAAAALLVLPERGVPLDRKSTRLNSSHPSISYAVFCLKKKKRIHTAV